MENKYYHEEIVKFSHWREEYGESLFGFLENEKISAESLREEYISPEKYKANSENYRQDFIDMLGFPLNKKRETPTLLKKEFVAEDGNVNIYRMQLLFFGKIKFYGILFEQKENKETAPFVVALHGGGGTAEVVCGMQPAPGSYNYLGRRITDRGANVFCPQLLLWSNEVYGANFDRNAVDGKLRQLGGSITALEVYMLRGSIDYFLENENMNSERVGVAGLSYGGMYTLFLSAVDTRIKSAYSSSWVNDCFIHSRPDWSYKDMQNKFTATEIGALVAPRAMVVAMGTKDELFDYKITETVCDEIREYYKAFGEAEKLKTVIFPLNHVIDVEDAEIAFLLENL